MKLMIECCFAAALSLSVWAGAEDWTRIYLAEEPVVTRDGKSFYFTWNDHIWFAPTAGGTARMVSSAAVRQSTPVLSPDGTRLAFLSDCEGVFHLCECPTAGGPVRQLTYHSESARPWCYTPDGKGLICTAWRDDGGDNDAMRIFCLPTAARGPETLLFDLYATAPSLSPDGKQLLFMYGAGSKGPFRKRRHSVTSQKGEIWLYDFATKKFRCIIERKWDVRSPVWAADGKSFYYLTTEQGGIRNLARHTLVDGKDMMLTHFTDEHVEHPSISADGKTAVFRQCYDFWRLDLGVAGAKPQKITLHPESGYVARASMRRRTYDRISNIDENGDVTFCSDGLQTAFTAGGVLWVMDTEIRQPQRVDGGARAFVRSCVFSPDGQDLYYVVDRGDGSDVRVARRSDPSRGWWENASFRIETRVSDAEIRHGFSLSPDGRQFAWKNPRGQLSFAGTNGVVKTRGPVCLDAGGYAWSPDGKWVAAAYGDLNDNTDIWIIAVDGSREPYNVSRNFLWDGSPAWSPDGKILAFIGECAEENSDERLFYVYLDKAEEEREAFDVRYEEARKKVGNGAAPAKKAEKPKTPFAIKIDFDGLCERVHMLPKVSAGSPFFSHDSRTIAFSSSGKTMKVHVPDRMTPQQLFAKTGSFRAWLAKGDRVLRQVNGHPAHGDTEFSFRAYDTIDIADWQELGFKTIWARIRDRFYDENFHGADWESMKPRYLPAARHATSYAVFQKVVEMMLGELDASHLGLRNSNEATREWKTSPKPVSGWRETTAHLGLRFDPTWKGDGWKICEVIKDGPAERSSFDFRPGDIVRAIDTVRVKAGDDPTLALNGPADREVTLTLAPRDAKKGAPEPQVRLKVCSFGTARVQKGAAKLRAVRTFVHEQSKNRLGYLNIAEMNMPSFWLFQKEVFTEGYGRDGLIIDVRENGGGNTADKVLAVLFGADHALVHSRDFAETQHGYPLGRWERPLWNKPIVVMCNENSASNAEILTHAIKNLKRGRVVGMPSSGNVISTWGRNVLDLGMLRDPHRGWHMLDGTDMEWHGAVPDVIVKNDPNDLVKGKDAQLEAAIKALTEDVAKAKAAEKTRACRAVR